MKVVLLSALVLACLFPPSVNAMELEDEEAFAQCFGENAGDEQISTKSGLNYHAVKAAFNAAQVNPTQGRRYFDLLRINWIQAASCEDFVTRVKPLSERINAAAEKLNQAAARKDAAADDFAAAKAAFAAELEK